MSVGRITSTRKSGRTGSHVREYSSPVSRKPRIKRYKRGLKVTDVPQWAFWYIRDGDESILVDGDREDCDEFLATLDRMGYCLSAPIDGSYRPFCSRPAFGVSAPVMDWKLGESRKGGS